MIGAILGDIIGQPYEFDRGHKTKDFPLFCKHPRFTDDTVMTLAICDGILKAGLDADENTMKTSMITSMQLWGHKYPHAGYGGKIYFWLAGESTKPYGSYGNGSAMRVSSVGWLFEILERTREVARWSAEVTHNHHVESCQETVPEAITAFLEGTSFEDVIRTAVSLGGDCDTLTDIATGMAEAFYGVPEELKAKCLEYTTQDMHEVIEKFRTNTQA